MFTCNFSRQDPTVSGVINAKTRHANMTWPIMACLGAILILPWCRKSLILTGARPMWLSPKFNHQFQLLPSKY